MKAILINPETREITEIQLTVNKDKTLSLGELYETLDCRYIDIIRLNDKQDLIIDDEGMLENPATQSFFAIKNHCLIQKLGMVVAGSAIVVDRSFHPEEGCLSVECTMTLEEATEAFELGVKLGKND